MCNRILIPIVCVIFIFTSFPGCVKEYSFEGGTTQNVQRDSSLTTNPDSSKTPAVVLSSCKGCEAVDTSTTKWSFKIGSSSLCGSVTKAIISSEGNAMTFFGPSLCSNDSGLIITAYFDERALTRDQSSITAGYTALEYYDNTTQFDVLKSKRPNVLSLTMYNYVKQTGTAYGVFNGWVVDKNNVPVKVDSGKFKIRF